MESDDDGKNEEWEVAFRRDTKEGSDPRVRRPTSCSPPLLVVAAA